MRDPYVLIEKAMTDTERAAVLAWFTDRNPRLVGASVADALDMAVDHDSFLAVREPFVESPAGQALLAELCYTDLTDEQMVRFDVLAACTVAAVALLDPLGADSPPYKTPPPAMCAVVRDLATRALALR